MSLNIKNLYLVNLGCNKNLVDSEVMLHRLRGYNLIDNPEYADVIVVNTCGFIGDAKVESIDTILELHDVRKKDSLLVAAGCLTQRYQEEIASDMPEIDIVTGVGDYDKIDELIELRESRFSPTTYLSDAPRVITGSSYHAYIKISEGCNQKCSFCAIPNFKGRLQSRRVSSILQEVQSLIDEGYYDFTFISQDTSSYGWDIKERDYLIKLIKAIDEIDGVKSARVLYLYPTTTSKELVQAIIDSPKFHNYFDMPIQHINNEMLKKQMKRGHGKDKIVELISIMKKAPDAYLRTGVIVGHPFESDEMYEELVEYIKEIGFNRVSVFTYFDEEGTPSYEYANKIDEKIIQNRANRLKNLYEDEIYPKKLKEYIGKTIDIVIDGESDEHEYLLSARALVWAPDIDGEIYVNDSELGDNNELLYGVIYKAYISELVGDKLLARVIS
jgi:ribosomal protein S12 methylthiotransferase RimO